MSEIMNLGTVRLILNRLRHWPISSQRSRLHNKISQNKILKRAFWTIFRKKMKWTARTHFAGCFRSKMMGRFQFTLRYIFEFFNKHWHSKIDHEQKSPITYNDINYMLYIIWPQSCFSILYYSADVLVTIPTIISKFGTYPSLGVENRSSSKTRNKRNYFCLDSKSFYLFTEFHYR